MGHAAPNSLGGCRFRLLPRRPGSRLGLFGDGPSAACSAEATGRRLPVLAGPAEAGEWFYDRQPHPADIRRTHAERGGWMIYFSAALVVVALLLAFLHVREGRSETRRIGAHLVVAILHWPSGFRPSSRSTGSATPALSRWGATNCPRPPASSPLATHLVGAVVALHVLPDPVEARCIRDRLSHRRQRPFLFVRGRNKPSPP